MIIEMFSRPLIDRRFGIGRLRVTLRATQPHAAPLSRWLLSVRLQLSDDFIMLQQCCARQQMKVRHFTILSALMLIYHYQEISGAIGSRYDITSACHTFTHSYDDASRTAGWKAR